MPVASAAPTHPTTVTPRRARRRPVRRASASAAALLAALLSGCATQQPDTARLEAAIERFERAAAEAEAAAAQAEESARHAEAAAQDRQFRGCAEAGRGPVRSVAQARRIGQAFLTCLALPWGEPVAIARVAPTPETPAYYRIDFGPDRVVCVAVDSGRADFPAAPAP